MVVIGIPLVLVLVLVFTLVLVLDMDIVFILLILFILPICVIVVRNGGRYRSICIAVGISTVDPYIILNQLVVPWGLVLSILVVVLVLLLQLLSLSSPLKAVHVRYRCL